ncbi:hypothetical protein PBI_SCTP2_453 [Salicola phage SCTP-2]|nr:hypothetical protein PBI_SCTP2_453 [Salicola phage SCTP-2]
MSDIDNEQLKNGNLKERMKYSSFLSKFSRNVVRKDSAVSNEAKYIVYYPYAANKWFFEGNGFKNTSKNARKTLGMFDIASTIGNIDIISVIIGLVMVVYYPQIFMTMVVVGTLISLLVPYLIMEKWLKLSKFQNELYNNCDGDIGKYILGGKTEKYDGELNNIQKTQALNYIVRGYPELLKYRTKSYKLFYYIYIALIMSVFYKYGMMEFMTIYFACNVITTAKNSFHISKYTKICEVINFDITDYFASQNYDEDLYPIIKINTNLGTFKSTSANEVKKQLNIE